MAICFLKKSVISPSCRVVNTLALELDVGTCLLSSSFSFSCLVLSPPSSAFSWSLPSPPRPLPHPALEVCSSSFHCWPLSLPPPEASSASFPVSLLFVLLFLHLLYICLFRDVTLLIPGAPSAPSILVHTSS